MNEINIISSDARYDALYKRLRQGGYSCKLCDINDDMDCRILILPIKSTLTDEELSSILRRIKSDALVFSGESERVKRYFNGAIVDYTLDEKFIDANAYITAECSIALAQIDSKRTMRGAKVAIIGYGRIGKHLTRLLIGMGAEVYVLARREGSRAEAEMAGAFALGIDGINEKRYDLIFNTVPSKIITRSQSDKIPRNTITYDLASLPGGFEDDAFPKRALALPGKMMPKSAGEAIFDFVERYFSNERK